MINFISHLPRDLRSGGFSAMNAAACAALAKAYPLNYVGPIDPPVPRWDKAASKALRASGIGGDFPAYSARRLTAIAREVERLAAPGAQLDFFHGLTMWSACAPSRPYVAWSDCTFSDYIDLFHDRARFRADDLARIARTEGAWLASARRVLFTSEWASARAISQHGLDPGRVASIGIFGEIEAPARDAYAGGANFAFVSTDYAAKGGAVALAAYRQLRETYPAASLTIVGASPGDISGEPGVTYAGYLRKEVDAEHQRFRDILASAVAVVHPTRSDIAPLLLVEAALFGCPAIATRGFAIPELVEHGETGWLLERPRDAGELAATMARLLENPDDYSRLRVNAWRRSRERHSKAGFEQRMRGCVADAMAAAGTAVA